MNHYFSALKKYATFKGRATRSEYWLFTLVNVIVVLGLAGMAIEAKIDWLINVAGLYWLATIIPSFSVAVRRLHDTGRSGWFLLLSFIPIVGVYVFIIMTTDSGEDNEYGPNPKTAPAMSTSASSAAAKPAAPQRSAVTSQVSSAASQPSSTASSSFRFAAQQSADNNISSHYIEQIHLTGSDDAGEGYDFAIQREDLDDGEGIIIGKSEEQAHLIIPSRYVSRSHAQLWIEDDKLYISDLGSSNGTSVNGNVSSGGNPSQLKDGDELRFGNVVLAVRLLKA